MAAASSLSRRKVLRPCGSATSMSGCPSPQRGQSRPPDQVRRQTGQIFSTVLTIGGAADLLQAVLVPVQVQVQDVVLVRVLVLVFVPGIVLMLVPEARGLRPEAQRSGPARSLPTASPPARSPRMADQTFDFFYDLGSPYSYLASTQLRGI